MYMFGNRSATVQSYFDEHSTKLYKTLHYS